MKFLTQKIQALNPKGAGRSVEKTIYIIWNTFMLSIVDSAVEECWPLRYEVAVSNLG